MSCHGNAASTQRISLHQLPGQAEITRGEAMMSIILSEALKI